MSSIDAPFSSQVGQAGNDDRPLTQQEFELLQRLLSDPFSVPIQFKSWLVSYLETSDLSLPMSAVMGLTAILGITGVGQGTLGILPAGLIFPYGGLTAPAGSKMCDGRSYSRTAEARLFEAIGTGFGSVDANSFNVPDIQERIPIGKGTIASANTLGQTESPAMPLGQRGYKHGHTGPVDAHVHGIGREVVSLTPGGSAYSISGNQSLHDAATDSASSTARVGPQSAAPADGPAVIVLNFIVVA